MTYTAEIHLEIVLFCFQYQYFISSLLQNTNSVRSPYRLDKENHILQLSTNVPLGCAMPAGIQNEFCYLKFDVFRADGVTSCGNVTDADQNVHSLCGVSVVGLTKVGLDKYGNNSWQVMDEYNYMYTNNDTARINEYFGAHIKLESPEDIREKAKTLIHLSVINNTAGHRLWDGYTVHPVEVYFFLWEK